MTSSAPPPLLPPDTERPADPPRGDGLRPPLRRSHTDKVLGGVSGGLADHTGIDTLLWRVGFVALTFAGGTGILVYLLLWLLMPRRRAGAPTPAAAEPVGPRSPVPGTTVAVLLIVVGLMALLARTTSWDPGVVAFLGAALLVVGIGLGVGAFAPGRAARGPLIALGVLLSFALLVASATGGGWRQDAGGRAGIGDRTEIPQTADTVPSRYESGVGDVTLDLTQLDLADLDRPITTRIDAAVGDVEVLVPASADVRVSVANGLGEADVFGQSSGGTFAGTGSDPWTGDDTPEIVLSVESGIGDVEVSRG
ncbi:MAG: hypothetical protein JWQ53_123 [Klenkia sp.]|nr:hypothetical protein [Klenkia sp.]